MTLMKLLAVFGTRPEAIKLAPLIKQLEKDPFFDLKVCVTAQHREMLDQVLKMFEITTDYDLNLMGYAQTLNQITAKILLALKESVFSEFLPDGIFVHGDTATTFAAALASFYEKIPVYHVEAGLRTGNLMAPWPEEANRSLVSILTQKHFAPTETAKKFLMKENISEEKITVTGNTVIDSLFQTLDLLEKDQTKSIICKKKFEFLNKNKKLILVTGHRRENFGSGFLNICKSLKKLAKRNDIQVVYPVHLNPNVRKPVLSILDKTENIHLLEPLDYLPFIYLMSKAYLILTDSGGIQEEAPSLGIPVLVMREVTERPEAVIAGTVKLVGTDEKKITQEVQTLIDNPNEYKKMSSAHNPYGDGKACSRITKELKKMAIKNKRLCIVGLGYIGLPTAALFAKEGMNVLGIDIKLEIIKTLQQGHIHIIEPGLLELVKIAVEKGLLKASLKPETCDFYIIAVPTPITSDKKPDDSYVMSAIESIAPVLKKNNLIIIESTSPVGTTEKAIQKLKDLRPDLSFPSKGSDKEDVHIAYCPERVIPGKALLEMTTNDRIIGCYNDKTYTLAKSFYEIIVKGACVQTTAKIAEMSKLTENAFRDVNIAFSNELANICDKLGMDCFELIRLANKHPRVNILQPGPGVGGHCIPIDPWFIVSKTPEEARLIRTARIINDEKPNLILKKIKKATERFSKPKIALLGLSFKADIDDLRESPAVDIAKKLLTETKHDIFIVEPYIKMLPKELISPKSQKVDLEYVQKNANIIVILVDHSLFKNSKMIITNEQVIIDTKGLLPEQNKNYEPNEEDLIGLTTKQERNNITIQ